MTKLRVVVLLAVIALLLFPAAALGQGMELPCRFYGMVTVDGANVADGTVITATVDGDMYTATTPAEGYGASSYALKIEPPEGKSYADGTPITFKIGANDADQTATWQKGGNVNLDLSIGEAGPGPVSGGITSVNVITLDAGENADVDYDPATGVLTISIPRGDPGAQGAQGAAGAAGSQGAPGAAGEDGKDAPGGVALPVIALIIAIIAFGVAVMGIRRKKA